MSSSKRFDRPVRIGLGGPVGSGKTMLALRLCEALRDEYSMAVITNDIYTLEDAQFLEKSGALDGERIVGVETGGSNIQFAVNPDNGRLVVIEMNPRVSRSSALASKAAGFPIAKFAAKLAVGYLLEEIRNDITRETPACFEPTIDYVVVKVPRFTFEKFASADPVSYTHLTLPTILLV